MLKRMGIAFTAWVVLMIAVHSQAATTNVFCSDLTNLSNWSWAKDLDGNQITANGEWHSAAVDGNNKLTFNYFLVAKSEFEKLNRYCSGNYVPQPGNYSISSWHIFVTQNGNGQLVAQKGILSTFYYDPQTTPPASINLFTIARANGQFVSHINTRLSVEVVEPTAEESPQPISQTVDVNREVRADWVPFDTIGGMGLGR
ncbi:hypothetical protein [Spartinivicinus ruber]|uniref:hypothetical protein n=1 Tax=Spartinivicinus ruber TaxID=2683272 RepID=UPI0013D8027E|nr:hypothetical protein [Spartinivicinus ruber]